MNKLLNTLNKEIRIVLWSICTFWALVKAMFIMLPKGQFGFIWFTITVCIPNNYAGARYQWLHTINPNTCKL